MRPVTVTAHISAPRGAVYDFVADLANHAAFTGHYLGDFRLARAKSDGLGAAARFKIERRMVRAWVEIQITEADRPRRIGMQGRTGRCARTPLWVEYDLTDHAGVTRVELTVWSDPATRFDRFLEVAAGLHGFLKRKNRRALERLRRIFEEPSGEPLPRVTVAGYERDKAARFGDHPEAAGVAGERPTAAERV